MSRLVSSLITTGIIIMIIPVIGFIVDKVVNIVISITARRMGRGLAWFIANRLTFMGTVHHELSHALFAFCTGAKVISVDLFKPEGNTLGKVTFATRGNVLLSSIQLTAASIAPVVTGCISTYLLYNKVLANCTELWQTSIVIYLLISIILHMNMSWQDIKNAIKGLPVCAILIFVIVQVTGFSLIH